MSCRPFFRIMQRSLRRTPEREHEKGVPRMLSASSPSYARQEKSAETTPVPAEVGRDTSSATGRRGEGDKKALKWIHVLIKDIPRDTFNDIGKSESCRANVGVNPYT